MLQAKQRTRSLRWTWIVAAVTLFLDSQYFFQGVTAALPLAGAILWLAVGACLRLLGRGRVDFGFVVKRLVIFGTSAALGITTNVANQNLAERRAVAVVEAVKTFHRDTKAYPKTLDALVPKYLPEVPRPRIALSSGISNRFNYQSGYPGTAFGPRLWWAIVPPFYRKFFSFENGQWTTMD